MFQEADNGNQASRFGWSTEYARSSRSVMMGNDAEAAAGTLWLNGKSMYGDLKTPYRNTGCLHVWGNDPTRNTSLQSSTEYYLSSALTPPEFEAERNRGHTFGHIFIHTFPSTFNVMTHESPSFMVDGLRAANRINDGAM